MNRRRVNGVTTCNRTNHPQSRRSMGSEPNDPTVWTAIRTFAQLAEKSGDRSPAVAAHRPNRSGNRFRPRTNVLDRPHETIVVLTDDQFPTDGSYRSSRRSHYID
ncbi:hypothetical protein C446_10180 [Halobiforma nitratireducens JCM 10879]|uniref:Uncharacterized protein n=1 Tax=Halobiforma nitratireducens JCM 10879 TaxID=1227454 RepID=M0M0R0_9EURY|nr:hypothetical protein C446_10180 [Halobiforma nitratireducens JCM 10879]